MEIRVGALLTATQRLGIVIVGTCAVCSALAQGPTYTDIHDFGLKITNANGLPGADGCRSNPVTFDSSGNMYGTTLAGGPIEIGSTDPAGHAGVLWEFTSNGVYKDLHDFGGTVHNLSGALVSDGQSPASSLTFDASGNIYGTTYRGGAYGQGMLFELSNTGVYTDLHDFGGTVFTYYNVFGPDGQNPQGVIAADSSGNIFGTCDSGCAPKQGNIWKFSTQSGSYTDMYEFYYYTYMNDGYFTDGPYSGVTLDSAGNLYGTAYGGAPDISYPGGLDSPSFVWKYTPGATGLIPLHFFGGTIKLSNGTFGSDGVVSYAPISFDKNGNLYGTAMGMFGTPSLVWGIIGGVYTDLHDFGGTTTNAQGTSGQDGDGVAGHVSIDSKGNLYGIAPYGGGYGDGMVWEVNPTTSQYFDLHDFGDPSVANIGGRNTADGAFPGDFSDTNWIAFDSSGNLYGSTEGFGGNSYYTGAGTIWTMGSLASVSVVPTGVAAGNKSTGTVTLGMPAPIGGTVVNLSSDNPDVAPPATVKVAAGTTTATFSILTNRITTAETAKITASQSATSVSTTLSVQPVTLAGFSYFANPLGGTTQTFTVDLTGPAPAGGLNVQLTSNNVAAIVPSAPIFIPSGATSAPFTVVLATVASSTSATITGTLGAVQKTAPLTIKAP